MTLLVVDWVSRPHLMNDERKLHWRALSGIHADWRKAGAQACLLERPPKMEQAFITTWTQYPKGTLPDADAHAPTLKCLLDGIVDAGVLPNDNREYVKAILFLASVKGPKGSRPTVYVNLDPTSCVIPDAYPKDQP